MSTEIGSPKFILDPQEVGGPGKRSDTPKQMTYLHGHHEKYVGRRRFFSIEEIIPEETHQKCPGNSSLFAGGCPSRKRALNNTSSLEEDEEHQKDSSSEDDERESEASQEPLAENTGGRQNVLHRYYNRFRRRYFARNRELFLVRSGLRRSRVRSQRRLPRPRLRVAEGTLSLSETGQIPSNEELSAVQNAVGIEEQAGADGISQESIQTNTDFLAWARSRRIRSMPRTVLRNSIFGNLFFPTNNSTENAYTFASLTHELECIEARQERRYWEESFDESLHSQPNVQARKRQRSTVNETEPFFFSFSSFGDGAGEPILNDDIIEDDPEDDAQDADIEAETDDIVIDQIEDTDIEVSDAIEVDNSATVQPFPGIRASFDDQSLADKSDSSGSRKLSSDDLVIDEHGIYYKTKLEAENYSHQKSTFERISSHLGLIFGRSSEKDRPKSFFTEEILQEESLTLLSYANAKRQTEHLKLSLKELREGQLPMMRKKKDKANCFPSKAPTSDPIQKDIC